MRSSFAGAAIAIGLHVALGAGMLVINPARFHSEVPIEIDVEDRLPPPDVKPAPEPPPPPPEPRPRVALRRAPAPALIPPPTPPPPSEEPPKAAEAPPVFGVTMSSTVSGPGGMAVPIGNTLMTKPGKTAKPAEAKPAGGEGVHAFSPVLEIYIAKRPEVVYEVKSEESYPPEARRMGLEGVVRFKIGIDEKGGVVEVKILERAGHGFDEVATKAMKQFKFSPAIANDGRPVPCRIEYAYRFERTE